ncbi:MAG: hypothetical protein MUF34_13760 [Polyangiaceae bacterium]|nr:hypothetical protein [Polyangiaceae bacterium]
MSAAHRSGPGAFGRAGRAFGAAGLGLGAALLAASCVVQNGIETDTFQLRVSVTRVDGSPLPGPEDEALCLDLRGYNPECTDGGSFLVSVEAVDLFNQRDTTFNGYARLNVRPGTLLGVEGDRAEGRNVRLEAGVAESQIVRITGAYGDTVLWAEDLGYTPVDPVAYTPACSDNLDNDGDGTTDFPADPDCAFANDDSETAGSYAAGVSLPLRFQLPTVAQAQGLGASSPYDQEGVTLETKQSRVVVTRIASDGFYVSDVEPDPSPNALPGALRQKPYGGLFVFSFSLPAGVAVCDRVGDISGTIIEFFGFTELTFPSFKLSELWISEARSGPCPMPTPAPITAQILSSSNPPADTYLEQYEGGLVQVRGARVASIFGPGQPQVLRQQAPPGDSCPNVFAFTFSPEASDCDLNGDGRVDFTPCSDEGACSTACYNLPGCSEWSSFRRVGNFRATLGPAATQTVLMNFGSVGGLEPPSLRNRIVPWMTGTLANFSGGPLNWTVEARCSDDIVLCEEGEDEAACLARTQTAPALGTSCVRERTAIDNDSESQ